MNAASPPLALARQLTDQILAEIPLNRAMALQLKDYDGEQLSFALPLAPNVNDKGCAFGGSIASALTVAGWGLVVLALRQRGEDCDVYVGESTVRYLSPIWQDFTAQARLAEGAQWPAFFAQLAQRGKARIAVHCQVPAAEAGAHASLQAQFVAKRRGG